MRKNSNLQSTIDSIQLSNQTLSSVINKQGDTISIQQAIIVDNTNSLNQLTDSIFKLKKTNQKNSETLAYYKGKTVTTIKDKLVPYTDTLAMKRFRDSLSSACVELYTYMMDSTITVPAVAKVRNEHFSMDLTVIQSGVMIDSLIIPDELSLRFVEKKHGIFKPSTVEVQFLHTNPHVKTTQSNSVIYKPKKKNQFLRWAIPIVAGAATGIIMSR